MMIMIMMIIIIIIIIMHYMILCNENVFCPIDILLLTFSIGPVLTKLFSLLSCL